MSLSCKFLSGFESDLQRSRFIACCELLSLIADRTSSNENWSVAKKRLLEHRRSQEPQGNIHQKVKNILPMHHSCYQMAEARLSTLARYVNNRGTIFSLVQSCRVTNPLSLCHPPLRKFIFGARTVNVQVTSHQIVLTLWMFSNLSCFFLLRRFLCFAFRSDM